MQYTFEFLQELYPDLAQLGRNIDDIFYLDPDGVLMKGRLFAEELSKRVATLEDDLGHLTHLRQVDRLEQLEREGILTKEIAKAFDSVRYIGNKASHEAGGDDLQKALQVHRLLFTIAVWFMELYGSHDFTSPEYSRPAFEKQNALVPEQLSELIRTTISQNLTSLLEQAALKPQVNEHAEPGVLPEFPELKEIDQPDVPISYPAADTHIPVAESDMIGGSQLLFQLAKLKESSKEAIENSNSFSEFKEYMHVKRPIERDLVSILEQAALSNQSQLVFLCGNVGDGKSHLLGYLNKSRQDVMRHFVIHNDATESFDPQKNSLDTLAEVLAPFSDEYFEHSQAKLILAINLGVLHNFLQSDYASSTFTKLVKFIGESGVFDSSSLADYHNSDHFHLISFSDWHPFGLTAEGPTYDYLMQIFSRLVSDDDHNPFFCAYGSDLNNQYHGAVITNYRLFRHPEVQKGIAKLLAKAIIQHKFILSTRALFNFLHDILVPAAAANDGVAPTIIEESEYLLPNLLFASPDRSSLLRIMSKLDPVHLRSQKIDDMLFQLNNTSHISKEFRKYIETTSIEKWIESLEGLGAFYELTQATKHLLSVTLIRLGYFLFVDKTVFGTDKPFEKYMSYLYAFNSGTASEMKGIYEETQGAVFAWRGSPRSNYIFMNHVVENVKTAQLLQLEPDLSMHKRDQHVLNRFKNSVVVSFRNRSGKEANSVEIDYPLYENLLKVLNGYSPNKKDKEDAIQFVEFIDKLIRSAEKQDELLVYQTHDGSLFTFKYDMFGDFTFKREQ